ncbi:MAG: EipA family protein [Hyphomicrobiaceae bacterium]
MLTSWSLTSRIWGSLAAALTLFGPLLGAGTPAHAQERLPWSKDEPPARIRPYEDTRRDWERDDRQPPPVYGEPAPRYDVPPPAQPYQRPAYAGREDAYRPPAPAPQYGAPYSSPYSTVPGDGTYRDNGYDRRSPRYEAPPPPPRHADYDRPRDGTFSMREILDTGHGFFGSISQGLGSVVEHAFKRQGRPNGYILGEDLGGAFVAGLRYGEGTLYTRDAGNHKVYWQGPSIGYDAGAEGSKVMVLVYNLRDPSEMYLRFGGVDGSAYVVGGVGLTFLANNHVTLAPIRAGVGLRLGANIGYLKYTRRPTWNPF